jgi:hypothetical protein
MELGIQCQSMRGNALASAERLRLFLNASPVHAGMCSEILLPDCSIVQIAHQILATPPGTIPNLHVNEDSPSVTERMHARGDSHGAPYLQSLLTCCPCDEDDANTKTCASQKCPAGSTQAIPGHVPEGARCLMSVGTCARNESGPSLAVLTGAARGLENGARTSADGRASLIAGCPIVMDANPSYYSREAEGALESARFPGEDSFSAFHHLHPPVLECQQGPWPEAAELVAPESLQLMGFPGLDAALVLHESSNSSNSSNNNSRHWVLTPDGKVLPVASPHAEDSAVLIRDEDGLPAAAVLASGQLVHLACDYIEAERSLDGFVAALVFPGGQKVGISITCVVQTQQQPVCKHFEKPCIGGPQSVHSGAWQVACQSQAKYWTVKQLWVTHFMG